MCVSYAGKENKHRMEFRLHARFVQHDPIWREGTLPHDEPLVCWTCPSVFSTYYYNLCFCVHHLCSLLLLRVSPVGFRSMYKSLLLTLRLQIMMKCFCTSGKRGLKGSFLYYVNIFHVLNAVVYRLLHWLWYKPMLHFFERVYVQVGSQGNSLICCVCLLLLIALVFLLFTCTNHANTLYWLLGIPGVPKVGVGNEEIFLIK